MTSSPSQIEYWYISNESAAEKSINSKYASFTFPLFSVSLWKPKELQLARQIVALGQVWISCSTEWPCLKKSRVLQEGAEHTRGKEEERGRLAGPKQFSWRLLMGQGNLFLGSNVHLPLTLLEGNCSCWLYFRQLVGLVSHLQRMRGTNINGKAVRKKKTKNKQVGTRALDTNRSKERKVRKCSEFCPVHPFLR